MKVTMHCFFNPSRIFGFTEKVEFCEETVVITTFDELDEYVRGIDECRNGAYMAADSVTYEINGKMVDEGEEYEVAVRELERELDRSMEEAVAWHMGW